MSNYITRRGKDYIKDRIILELGSGTGLVGIVAGTLGGRVWITDQGPLLNVMRKNVRMNKLEGQVKVAELNWGSLLPRDLPRPDLILAADCVYFEPAFPLLVHTLSDLADSRTEVLFCYKKRRKADKRFFKILRKTFHWSEVQDDPDKSSYSADAISLLQLVKKKE